MLGIFMPNNIQFSTLRIMAIWRTVTLRITEGISYETDSDGDELAGDACASDCGWISRTSIRSLASNAVIVFSNDHEAGCLAVVPALLDFRSDDDGEIGRAFGTIGEVAMTVNDSRVPLASKTAGEKQKTEHGQHRTVADHFPHLAGCVSANYCLTYTSRLKH